MNYWLDLFTGTTWREFRDSGAQVSGFRSGRTKARARHIKPGDVFLAFMVGVSRWVGLLEVTSERFEDATPIFTEEVFPIRFQVKPLVMLDPEEGLPMEELRGKLSFFPPTGSSRQWSGHVRASPTKYGHEDGKTIAAALREAAANPRSRPVDSRLLERSSNLYKRKTKTERGEVEEIISVPRDDDEAEAEATEEHAPTHTEIQGRLLDLGSNIGLSVWAPRSDRSRTWNSRRLGDTSHMIDTLPTQFDDITNATIENIDVIWFSGQAMVAAFEVEHTSSIYSGLLRLSDLLTMQPNLDTKMYLVGPDERETKFRREIARATFSSGRKPLYSLCSFVPYSALCSRLEEAKNVLRYVKPEFLDEIAVAYDPANELFE